MGSSCVVLPHDSFDISLARVKVKPRLSLSFYDAEEEAFDRNSGLKYLSHVCSMDGRFTSESQELGSEKRVSITSHRLLDQGMLSCVTCGILSFSCVAIIEPTDSSSLIDRDQYDDAIFGDASNQKCHLRRRFPLLLIYFINSFHLESRPMYCDSCFVNFGFQVV